jgi:hypothetical protein
VSAPTWILSGVTKSVLVDDLGDPKAAETHAVEYGFDRWNQPLLFQEEDYLSWAQAGPSPPGCFAVQPFIAAEDVIDGSVVRDCQHLLVC